jgi:hypothetical protein
VLSKALDLFLFLSSLFFGDCSFEAIEAGVEAGTEGDGSGRLLIVVVQRR